MPTERIPPARIPVQTFITKALLKRIDARAKKDARSRANMIEVLMVQGLEAEDRQEKETKEQP